MTWPPSAHLALALATGLACGKAAAHYPDVIAPSYAAITGAIAVYPAMIAVWWYLHRWGADRR